MFPRNENRNEGTFAFSPGTRTGTYVCMFPGTRTGTRAHSPKPPFCETALLSPSDFVSEERDRGGQISENLRGKISKFQGPLKFAPFYGDSFENRQFGSQKSKVSRGNFRGPPSIQYVWAPCHGFQRLAFRLEFNLDRPKRIIKMLRFEHAS